MTEQPARPRFRIAGHRAVHVTALPGDLRATGNRLVCTASQPALCGITVGHDRAETTTDTATCRDCTRSTP